MCRCDFKEWLDTLEMQQYEFIRLPIILQHQHQVSVSSFSEQKNEMHQEDNFILMMHPLSILLKSR